MKVYVVTSSKAPKGRSKRTESRVMGFVTVFGWESAEAKAAAKYPTLENFQVHLKR